MRKILGFIVVLFLSATPGIAYAQSHWSCDIYQYQYSMSVYYSLENINNISDYEVAAFVGNECRGVGKVLSTDGQTYGYIRVRSNKTSGETVSFMIYDKKNKLEHAINTTLAFKTDAAIGYPSSPTMLGVSTIDEDPIVVTANSYTRVYGEGNPLFDYTFSGATLTGTPEITCSATPTSPVGTYDIVISKGSVTNDNASYVNGTLTITKAALKIKAGTYTRMLGEDNPEFTLTYEGFKNGETDAVLTKKPIVETTATKESAIGEYQVKVSGAKAKNYKISYVNGTLIIETCLGDANGDGVVNAADIVAVICDIKGHTPVGFVKKAADVNKDNNINNSDVEAIANIIMKER